MYFAAHYRVLDRSRMVWRDKQIGGFACPGNVKKEFQAKSPAPAGLFLLLPVMARKKFLPREKSSFDLLQDERTILEKQIKDRGHLVNDADRAWRGERLREVKREINRLFAEGYKSRLR